MNRDGLSAEAWERHWRARRESHLPGLLDRLRGFLIRKGDFSRLVLEETGRAGVGKACGPVLEAGSGSASILSAIHAAGSLCIALDSSMSACRLAAGISPGPVRGSVAELPFRDGSIGSAFAVGVLDQLSRQTVIRSIAELARVLEPGGVAVLINNSSRSAIHRIVMRRMLRKGTWAWGPKSAFESLSSETGSAAPFVECDEAERGWLLQWRFCAYLLPGRGPWRRAFNAAFLLCNAVLWPLNRFAGMVLVTVLRKPHAMAGEGERRP